MELSQTRPWVIKVDKYKITEKKFELYRRHANNKLLSQTEQI